MPKVSCSVQPVMFGLLFLSCFSFIYAHSAGPGTNFYLGETVGDGEVHEHLGIHYAHASRFKPAQVYTGPPKSSAVKSCPQFQVDNPLTPNVGMLITLSAGAPTVLTYICLVNPNFPKDLTARPDQQDEDCLQLNIWAPRLGGDGTVMVFFYGGGFQTGWIGSTIYNGTHLVKNQKVVVVTVNYRVGVFGFPSSAQIPLKDRNLGFGDQRVALKWVQENIRAFGGDPKKITIWGESAGASSVDDMTLTSTDDPKTSLFRAGIAQSGTSYLVTVPIAIAVPSPPALQISAWDQLAAALQCTRADSLSCVTNKSQAEIIAAVQTNGIGFNPVYDGNVTMVGNDTNVRLSKRGKKYPMLAGSNTGEGYSFGLSIANVLQPLVSQVTDVGLKKDLNIVLAMYTTSEASDRENSRALLTALGFQCAVRRESLDSSLGGSSAWRYLYNATFQSLAWTDPAAASHGIEVPIIFGTWNESAVVASERSALRNLSNNMQKIWADFARNPEDFDGWPKVGNNESVGVWNNGGFEKMTFLEADGVDGTQKCKAIDRVFARVPQLLERSISR